MIDICDDFIEKIIPLCLICVLVEFVFNKSFDRNWFVLIVNQKAIILLHITIHLYQKLRLKRLKQSQVMPATLQLLWRMRLFSHLDICELCLFFQSERVTRFIRMELNHLYHVFYFIHLQSVQISILIIFIELLFSYLSGHSDYYYNQLIYFIQLHFI